VWKQQNVSKHTYFTHVNAKQLQRPINHHDIKAGTLLKGLEGVSISQTTYITPLCTREYVYRGIVRHQDSWLHQSGGLRYSCPTNAAKVYGPQQKLPITSHPVMLASLPFTVMLSCFSNISTFSHLAHP